MTVEGLCSGRQQTLSSSYSQSGVYLTSHFRIINVQYYCLLKFEIIGTKYLIVFSLKVTHLRCNLLQLPNRFQLPCNAGFITLLFLFLVYFVENVEGSKSKTILNVSLMENLEGSKSLTILNVSLVDIPESSKSLTILFCMSR